MSILHVDHNSLPKIISQGNKTVLVDFFATWCGPCRMVAPILEEIDRERSDVQICKVDVDQQRELALEYNVSSIPTLIVFKNGQLTDRTVGAVPKDSILKML